MEPASESPTNLMLMRLIDEQHLEHPHMGRKSMTQWLNLQGHDVNIKRVRRLMDLMDLVAIYPRPRTTLRNPDHAVYPYLLRGVRIDRVNQVWSTDITYIPMERGFMYLTAVIDWHSRHVLSWRLSNTLDSSFCVDAVEDALSTSGQRPEIFNTDQGVQFTSRRFIEVLQSRAIKVSMDGKGRAIDNVFIERLWRSLKYEDIYLKVYETAADLYTGLTSYFEYYSTQRPQLHVSLGFANQASIFFSSLPGPGR